MIAAKTKQRTDELIASIKRKPVNLGDVCAHAEHHAHSLLYDARLAYLDGRMARRKELVREANRLLRAMPSPPAPQSAES